MCCNRKVEIEQVKKTLNEHLFSWNFQREKRISLGKVETKLENRVQIREIDNLKKSLNEHSFSWNFQLEK